MLWETAFVHKVNLHPLALKRVGRMIMAAGQRARTPVWIKGTPFLRGLNEGAATKKEVSSANRQLLIIHGFLWTNWYILIQ